MLINLRNALMAGKRLPYDAEVEYLESTGTQYIDTGVYGNALTAAICSWSYRDAQSGAVPFGSRTSAQSKAFAMTGWSSLATKDLYFNFSTKSEYLKYNGNDVYAHKWECRAGQGGSWLKKDGVTVYSNSASVTSFTTEKPILLFGMWNDNSLTKTDGVRIEAFSLYNNNTLVRDYIPVRKGAVGYLYDRVSGQLFGNAGTGDFVVGQDVVPVEWLGNGASGSYILTNTHSGKDVSCNIKFAIVNPSLKPSTTQDCRLFPIRGQRAWNYNSYAMFFQCQSNQSDYGRMSFHGHNDAFSGVLATDSIFDINVSADGTNTVGITGTINGGPISSVSASISNITGNDYFRMLENIAVPDTGSCGLRLLGCSLIKGGQEINKYLPVRVGTEGAMMDVLTRRVYRNQGTGAFGYGNDLKYPIPSE